MYVTFPVAVSSQMFKKLITLLIVQLFSLILMDHYICDSGKLPAYPSPKLTLTLRKNCLKAEVYATRINITDWFLLPDL